MRVLGACVDAVLNVCEALGDVADGERGGASGAMVDCEAGREKVLEKGEER